MAVTEELPPAPARPAFTLLGADGRRYRSTTPGTLGGHRRARLYGRLDCPSALRALAAGGYVRHRVFFADEPAAVAAATARARSVCPPSTRPGRRGGRRRREHRAQPFAPRPASGRPPTTARAAHRGRTLRTSRPVGVTSAADRHGRDRPRPRRRLRGRRERLRRRLARGRQNRPRRRGLARGRRLLAAARAPLHRRHPGRVGRRGRAAGLVPDEQAAAPQHRLGSGPDLRFRLHRQHHRRRTGRCRNPLGHAGSRRRRRLMAHRRRTHRLLPAGAAGR